MKPLCIPTHCPFCQSELDSCYDRDGVQNHIDCFDCRVAPTNPEDPRIFFRFSIWIPSKIYHNAKQEYVYNQIYRVALYPPAFEFGCEIYLNDSPTVDILPNYLNKPILIDEEAPPARILTSPYYNFPLQSKQDIVNRIRLMLSFR